MKNAKYHVIEITEDEHKIVRIQEKGEMEAIYIPNFKTKIMEHLLGQPNSYTLTEEQTQEILRDYIDKQFENQKQDA